MRRFGNHPRVQLYGAYTISSINGLEPTDIKCAHGEVGYNSIAVTSVEMAVLSPPSLQIGQRSWQEVVLATYPRLRVRA